MLNGVSVAIRRDQSRSKAVEAQMNADMGKVKGKSKFYHPLRSSHRGHRGKAGENLENPILG